MAMTKSAESETAWPRLLKTCGRCFATTCPQNYPTLLEKSSTAE